MKYLIVFYLLLSGSYGYSHPFETTSAVSEETDSKKSLNILRDQLKRYVDSLMLVFLNEKTPKQNQIEILEEIQSIAELNGEITTALSQLSQSGIAITDFKTSQAKFKDENISLWVKTQTELIRRKQLALDSLQRRERKLDHDFWVNLTLDGVVIVTGGVLFFVPAIGPVLSIPLTAGRISLTGQKLGAILMATGSVESGLELWNYFFKGEEEEGRALSFVSDLVLRDVLTKELFNILSSVQQRDKYLAINLFGSADEENFIKALLNSMEDDQYSVQARLSSMRALRAFKDMEGSLKEKVISALKEVIDKSDIPALRETALPILGEMGEGDLQVAEYLEEKGDETNKNEKLRLIALIQLGRDKAHFSSYINLLADWLKDRDHKQKPLSIQPEIPDSFVNSLLLVESSGLSENHLIVVKEFILSGILSAELKLRFSETLLSWDKSPENKALIKTAYTDIVRELDLYVEDLFEGNLFEENYPVYQFLQERIDKIKAIENPEIAGREIERMMKELKKTYSNQIKIVKKVENFLNSLKKLLESL